MNCMMVNDVVLVLAILTDLQSVTKGLHDLCVLLNVHDLRVCWTPHIHIYTIIIGYIAIAIAICVVLLYKFKLTNLHIQL